MYTFEGLKEIYKIRGTFLDYEAVIRKIPRAWQEKINANTDICINLKYNVQINPYIKFILKDEKGCRSIYDKIVSVNQLLLTNKWTKELGDITSEEMKVYNRNLKYVKEIKLRDFQNDEMAIRLNFVSFTIQVTKHGNMICRFAWYYYIVVTYQVNSAGGSIMSSEN